MEITKYSRLVQKENIDCQGYYYMFLSILASVMGAFSLFSLMADNYQICAKCTNHTALTDGIIILIQVGLFFAAPIYWVFTEDRAAIIDLYLDKVIIERKRIFSKKVVTQYNIADIKSVDINDSCGKEGLEGTFVCSITLLHKHGFRISIPYKSCSCRDTLAVADRIRDFLQHRSIYHSSTALNKEFYDGC
jgi:hypothetical protein